MPTPATKPWSLSQAAKSPLSMDLLGPHAPGTRLCIFAPNLVPVIMDGYQLERVHGPPRSRRVTVVREDSMISS